MIFTISLSCVVFLESIHFYCLFKSIIQKVHHIILRHGHQESEIQYLDLHLALLVDHSFWQHCYFHVNCGRKGNRIQQWLFTMHQCNTLQGKHGYAVNYMHFADLDSNLLPKFVHHVLQWTPVIVTLLVQHQSVTIVAPHIVTSDIVTFRLWWQKPPVPIFSREKHDS